MIAVPIIQQSNSLWPNSLRVHDKVSYKSLKIAGCDGTFVISGKLRWKGKKFEPILGHLVTY